MSEEVETIEILREREFKVTIRRSEDIKELLKALIAAQKEFGPVYRTQANEAYKRGGKASKYADLASVVEATQPALNAHDLLIMQHAQAHSLTKDTVVTTSLWHVSGQFIESDLTVPSVNSFGKFDPQAVASAVTYARRIAWQAMTGTAPEDDDGNAAAGVGTKEAAQAVAKQKIEKAASEGSKTAQSVLKQADPLLYVFPKSHNGNYAEFYVRPYLRTHPEDEDGLKLVFSAHKAKKTKDETALVPSDQMESLLNALAGDYGVTLYQLEAK